MRQETRARLDATTTRLRAAREDAEAARAEWIEAMRAAHREGESLRAIGEVVGLTRQRVAELLK